MHKYILIAIFSLGFFSCERKPKVIEPDNSNKAISDKVSTLNQELTTDANSESMHTVTVNDILQADRYTYLNVNEGSRKYWIATSKMEAKKGNTFYYSGGLLKINFESQEFKRTFDTIYLVSRIISTEQHAGSMTHGNNEIESKIDPSKLPPIKNSIKISNIFTNKNLYNGKSITISGKCTKVNNGIMGRNWVHINDGSKLKGKEITLTVTTSEIVNTGENVAFNGKISLNKDFGAGYKYEIIMEEATIVK